MAHAVEGRYPFLGSSGWNLFAARLPASLKDEVLDQKYLEEGRERIDIPEVIRTRAKQPYRVRDGLSFLSGHDEFVGDLLSSQRIKQDGVFDPRATDALVRKFRSGRETSVKDNMALTGILSTTVLLDRFMHGRNALSSPASQERHTPF